MNEPLYGRLIVQHGRGERAGVAESRILYASRFASRESICGLQPIEIVRIEWLGWNSEISAKSPNLRSRPF